VEEFATFQDSHGTRKANLAQAAEMAYCGKKEKCELGLVLGGQAQSTMLGRTIPLLHKPSSDGARRILTDHHHHGQGLHYSKVHGMHRWERLL
jgi:hypothetical protein